MVNNQNNYRSSA